MSPLLRATRHPLRGWRASRRGLDDDRVQTVVAEPVVRWPSGRVRAAYVVGVAVFTVVMLVLAGAGVIDVLALVLLAVPIGPLGLLLVVLAYLTEGFLVLLGVVSGDAVPLGQPSVLALDAVVLAVVVGVALLNVRFVARAARSPAPNPPGYRSAVPLVADHLLAGSVHLFAALGFVLLCVLCGAAAVMPHGLDVQVSDAEAHARIVRAGVTWVVGFAAALAALAAWVVRSVLGRPLLRWALASLVVQTALVGVALLPA